MNDTETRRPGRAWVTLQLLGIVAGIVAGVAVFGLGIAALFKMTSFSDSNPIAAGVLYGLGVAAVVVLMKRFKRRSEVGVIANPAVGTGDERQQVLSLKANSFAGEVGLFYGMGFFALVTFVPSALAWVQWLILGGIFVFFVSRFSAAWYLSRQG